MSIFPIEKRESIRAAMLDAGIVFIKEKGLQHVTVSEITHAVGIGKGTFYHFYDSKEIFLYEVIRYSKEQIFQKINELVEENGKLTRESFQQLFAVFAVNNANNIISYLTLEDEQWLAQRLPDNMKNNPAREDEVIDIILSNCQGIQTNIDYRVLSNMMKIMALAVESKEYLYQDALKENIRLIQKQMMDYIFV